MATANQNQSSTATIEIPRLLDWRSACKAIGGDRPISRRTLDRLTKAGVLKVRRVGPGVVRWAAEDIAEFLSAATFPRDDSKAA
jgi:predicted DNA-binding transcriptional regulator AlpA